MRKTQSQVHWHVPQAHTWDYPVTNRSKWEPKLGLTQQHDKKRYIFSEWTGQRKRALCFPSEHIFRKANAWGGGGRLRVDEGRFGKVCYVDSWDSGLTRIESCLWDQLLSFLVEGNPLQMHIPLVVKQREGRELYFHLLLLDWLQLKIVLLKWHILGWHIVLHSNSIGYKVL